MLIYMIKNIEEVTKSAFYDMNTLKFDEVAKRLIVLVDSTNPNRILSNDQMKIGLKILRKIIEMENMNHNNPSCDW